jgi:cardiolipin synthase
MNWQTILLGTLFGFTFPWFVILHIIIVFLFAFRLIWIKRPVSVAIAWALVIVLLPFIGLILYLIIGQKPVGIKLTKKLLQFNIIMPI